MLIEVYIFFKMWLLVEEVVFLWKIGVVVEVGGGVIMVVWGKVFEELWVVVVYVNGVGVLIVYYEILVEFIGMIFECSCKFLMFGCRFDGVVVEFVGFLFFCIGWYVYLGWEVCWEFWMFVFLLVFEVELDEKGYDSEINYIINDVFY